MEIGGLSFKSSHLQNFYISWTVVVLWCFAISEEIQYFADSGSFAEHFIRRKILCQIVCGYRFARTGFAGYDDILRFSLQFQSFSCIISWMFKIKYYDNALKIKKNLIYLYKKCEVASADPFLFYSIACTLANKEVRHYTD